MDEIIDMLNNTEIDESSYIMVIGVGGGGSNAVQYMYDIGVHNVNFIICNTDAQALRRSTMPVKIQLGGKLTNGLGAGNQPEKGRDAALETEAEITERLVSSNARMVFITAGMGGGTGTGAAPVIAKIAKELGILTVGIVTIPFRLEGPKRLRQAEAGLEELKQYVDSLIVIDNENICKMYGDLDFSDAFSKADDILAIAAKGIAEAVTKEHKVNVDFADVSATMSNSGIALLGYASAEVGCENIAIDLTEEALSSPLLNQNNINGAQDIMINISWNKKELKMGELVAVIGHVQAAAGSNANIIWGAGADESLPENTVSLIIIATRFGNNDKIDLGANIHTDNMSKERIAPTKVEAISTEELFTGGAEATTEDIATEENTESATESAVAIEKEDEVEYVSFDGDENPTPAPTPAPIEHPDIVIHDVEGLTFESRDVKHHTKRHRNSDPDRAALQFEEDPIDLQVKKQIEESPKHESPLKKYTLDEIESLPAYKRREVLQRLKLELEK